MLQALLPALVKFLVSKIVMETSRPIFRARRRAKLAKKEPAGPPPIMAIFDPFLRGILLFNIFLY